MVAANTADDLSSYLADRYGGRDFILQSKDNLRFGKIDSMTPSWNIFHLIFSLADMLVFKNTNQNIT